MIRLRDRLALNITPLLLRLLLGVLFIWAGLGKVSASSQVEGDEAAILANMSVIPAPAAIPSTPVTPAPATGPAAKPGEPAPKPSTGGEPDKSGASGAAPAALEPSIVLARQTSPVYKASDFPHAVTVLNVYRLAGGIYKAAHPSPTASGGSAMALWPIAIGDGRWPVYLAWAVALTELIGGAAVLLGLFTRLMAVALAGVMIGAIWLTQIGPAIQSGNTMLGVLPDHPAFDLSAWKDFWIQFTLLMSALALAFCGPGRASLDRAILGGPDGEDDDE